MVPGAIDEGEGARERILREATRLFGHAGYAGASVREVVEAAGVTKPTLYYYFKNKEDLFRQAVDVQIEGLRSLVDHTVASPGTVRERLRGFLLVYVGGALENPDSVRMMMASAAAGSHPRVDVFERTHVEILRLRELIAQGVATGELSPAIDPGLAISMLVGAANATFVGALLGDAVRPDYADRILDLLYRGVAR